MSSMPLGGKELRTARLSRSGDGRYVFVPLDHSVSDGPITSAKEFAKLVQNIVEGGADGVVVHKGRARMIPPHLLARSALVVHLSASTAHAPDADAKVLVGDVEEAVQLGADAVSVHVNIGSDTEARQLADLGAVASACDRWGMPLIAMMYPRGPRVTEATRPDLVAHAASIAVDLGADVVKTVFALPAQRMAEVVDSCPLPVIVAGGSERGQSLTALATAALDAGCSGVAVGRRVFASGTPKEAVRELARVIHRPRSAQGNATDESAIRQHMAGVA